ncbi:MAG: secretin and TonB N-terminal domain-containing protein, partial [Pseudomonadota bacterium]
MKSIANRLHTLAACLLLSACAGSQTFKEGNALLDAGQIDQGLAKLEQAAHEDPHNAEYRIVLLNRKLKLVNAMNSRADTLRLKGQSVDATALYEQALAIDPANLIARQGLAALAQDQRLQQTMADAEALLQRGGDANLTQAQEMLRPLLVERPNQRDLQRLKTRLNDAQARLRPASGRLAVAYRKPVTLEFRDVPLRSVFDFLSKISGLNFVFDKDVKTDLKASISLKNSTIEAAIYYLLVTNQLEQQIVDGNTIMIYPNLPAKLKEYQEMVVKTFFLANADAKLV